MLLDKFYFGSYQFSVADQAKLKCEYHKHKNNSALHQGDFALMSYVWQ